MIYQIYISDMLLGQCFLQCREFLKDMNLTLEILKFKQKKQFFLVILECYQVLMIFI